MTAQPAARRPARAAGVARRWAVVAAVAGAVLLAAELTLTLYALGHSTSDTVSKPAGDAKTVYAVSFDASRTEPEPACVVQPTQGPQRTVSLPRHAWAAAHQGTLIHLGSGEELSCTGDNLYVAEGVLARLLWLDPYGWLLLPAVVLLAWGLRRAFGVSLAFWLPRRWRGNA